MIPPGNGLPWVSGGKGLVDPAVLADKFRHGQTVPFSLNRNLRVYVTLIKKYSPISKPVWSFRTHGLTTVGQDEVVILLVRNNNSNSLSSSSSSAESSSSAAGASAEEKGEKESLPARSIFEHLQHLYEQAAKGAPVGNMGHSVVLSGKEFLNSHDYGGFLFIRHSFQCLDGLDLPGQQPFLFGLLLTKWEMPWAKVFPLRLLLRLGAESRYYPAPLWSIRGRKTVYREIGNTIMKLLSDFRNFTYSLPIIRGLVIHMEDKLTTVIIPKSSLPLIQRALANSNEPVLALGANFSSTADSHLVAVQRDDEDDGGGAGGGALSNSDYQTQAINIANKTRTVTGASFLVLNGALKSSSGLRAKSSIIEDGIMVQVGQDRMSEIRKQLAKMQDVRIDCGPIIQSGNSGTTSDTAPQPPDETVHIRWMDKCQTVNAGVKSCVDGRPMDGVSSVRMIHSPSSSEFAGKSHLVRWTEVFIMPNGTADETGSGFAVAAAELDPTRVASVFAKAVCVAVIPLLKQLKNQSLSPFAVKISLDPENTGYEAGSGGSALPAEFMSALDNELVPLVHGQSSPTSNSFELVFHILDI